MRNFYPFQVPNGIGTNVYKHMPPNQIPQLLRGGIDQLSVNCNSSFPWLELHSIQQILELHKIKEINKRAMVLECAN
jgi:hypothetical protein